MDRRTLIFTAAGALGAATVSPGFAATAAGGRITLRIDTEAAEALLAAMERTSITEQEIDRLLALRGMSAMVDNVTKYLPQDTRETFRTALRQYVETRNPTVGHYGLKGLAPNLAAARKLIARLKSDPDIAREVARPLELYLPPGPPLTATVYCVVGGASDGFVLDHDPEPAFFMAIDRAQGDMEGVKLNMTHELYHVAQRAARSRVPGLNARVFDAATAPSTIRLLSVVLEEGTATYVAEAMKTDGAGPYMTMWRSNYAKNAPPGKIVENFKVFDDLLTGLRSGATSWEQAQQAVFSGYGPPPYFVGYEMAKAIDRRWGPRRIGGYFRQHPAAFFQDYVALCRERPQAVPARFSPANEGYVNTLGRT